MISVLNVGRYEPGVLWQCILDNKALQPIITWVCIYRVARVNQMSLTDEDPHLEYYGEVSTLNDGQVDSGDSGGHSRTKTARILRYR